MWNIGMPNLGHTMEEGKVGSWLKQVGEPVAKGEVIAEIETDKASFDVESPGDGVLLAVHVGAGATVAVGTVIGTVGAAGEAAAPAGAAARNDAAGPVRAEAAHAAPAPAARSGRAASPAARALAAELGVDLATVQGTGEDGIVTRDDIRAAHAARQPDRSDQPAGPTPMRRAIAEAMEVSWRTIPHVTLTRSVDVSALLAARRPGLTEAVVRALALALARHGSFNGWMIDRSFRPAASVDIGVAVSVPGGLVMPVLRGADRKAADALGRELGELAGAARAGRLDGSQTVDGSCSLTNLGRWDIEAFTPIIFPPQVAILGVGAVGRVAREAADGGVRFASELRLCLVFDHRANDGAGAAEFLASIAGHLSDPDTLGDARG